MTGLQKVRDDPRQPVQPSASLTFFPIIKHQVTSGGDEIVKSAVLKESKFPHENCTNSRCITAPLCTL